MLGIAKARAIPRSVRRGVRQAVSRLPATKQKRASLRVLRYGGSRGKAPPQATNARIGGKPFRWAASRLRTVCCWPCETGWCWEEAGPFSSSGWVARLDGSGPKESCSCRPAGKGSFVWFMAEASNLFLAGALGTQRQACASL